MVVQSGELIDAGRRFPGEDFAGIAGAEECFVGEPVKLPHAALGLGAKRNAGRLEDECESVMTLAGRVIFGA